MPNVKTGDIARVIEPGQYPMALVGVLGQASRSYWVAQKLGKTIWECETLSTVRGVYSLAQKKGIDVPSGKIILVDDAVLRPLYDGDGQDEVVVANGKPHPTIKELVEHFSSLNQAIARASAVKAKGILK